MDAEQVSTFLDALVRWARCRPDVEAVALVGSHARGTANALSDLDVVVLTREVDAYLSAPSWMREFGDPGVSRLEPYGALTSLRVVYANGAEIEFGFARPDWAAVPADSGTFAVARDGMVSLWDPHGLLAALSRHMAACAAPDTGGDADPARRD